MRIRVWLARLDRQVRRSSRTSLLFMRRSCIQSRNARCALSKTCLHRCLARQPPTCRRPRAGQERPWLRPTTTLRVGVPRKKTARRLTPAPPLACRNQALSEGSSAGNFRGFGRLDRSVGSFPTRGRAHPHPCHPVHGALVPPEGTRPYVSVVDEVRVWRRGIDPAETSTPWSGPHTGPHHARREPPWRTPRKSRHPQNVGRSSRESRRRGRGLWRPMKIEPWWGDDLDRPGSIPSALGGRSGIDQPAFFNRVIDAGPARQFPIPQPWLRARPGPSARFRAVEGRKTRRSSSQR